MPIQTATAEWHGNLRQGRGRLTSETGKLDTAYSFASRFETERETNPEELIGAAHAGCFTMALVAALDRAGAKPERIRTEARVSLEKDADGFRITYIELHTEGTVPGIDAETFARHADEAKRGCPVSRALAGVEIRMTANLAR